MEPVLRDASRTWCRGTRYWTRLVGGVPRVDLVDAPGHDTTRERERCMRGVSDRKRTQPLLSGFGPIRPHFALKRHLPRTSRHRKQLAAQFAAWRECTEVAQDPSMSAGNGILFQGTARSVFARTSTVERFPNKLTRKAAIWR